MLIFSLVISCKKEDDSVSKISSKTSSYYPLTVGSYWIYGHYDIDTLGNETALPEFDSVTISGILNIRGHAYHVFTGTEYPYGPTNTMRDLRAVRDSSGYIVDTNGRILFSDRDFSDSLHVNYEVISNNDTLHTDVFQMRSVSTPVSVPAGTFSQVLNYHGSHRMYLITLPPFVPNPRDYSFYYAKGVGKILNTYFWAKQAGYSERRLLRYRVI